MSIPQKPDLIREAYKRYKKKKPPPDFCDVIDIRTLGSNGDSSDRVTKICFAHRKELSSDACKVGLKNPAEWDAFLVKRCPGFMIIRNPFSPAAQKYWCFKALTEYAMKPYPCNLDIHVEEKDRENLWGTADKENSSSSNALIDRLRWSHLGYHFDYNFVNYKEEKYYGFPEDLSLLMKVIASIIGYENYAPETAIVNYYPIGSSMGGHTDHYEEELNAPLLSVSFGQPCVFLIGGPTKDIKPEAIWIKSGDLVVMANESRVAFHAVPCIVKESDNDEPPEPLKVPVEPGGKIIEDNIFFSESSCHCDTDNCKENLWSQQNMNCNEWEPIAKYLSKNRININVRQVHKR